VHWWCDNVSAVLV